MRIRSGLVLLVAVGTIDCTSKKSMPELEAFSDVLKKDPKISADPNVKACLDGDAKGCATAAEALMRSEMTGNREEEAASAADALGCRAGGMQECGYFAGALCEGRGVKKDVDWCARLYQYACDGNDGNSCTLLGDLYVTGAGRLAKDADKAIASWDRSCTLREVTGCDAVVEYYKKMQNPRKAVEYGTHACETVPEACYLPALLLTTTGIDGNTDRERARPLLRRACVDGGNPEACGDGCNLGDSDLCGRSKNR